MGWKTAVTSWSSLIRILVNATTRIILCIFISLNGRSGTRAPAGTQGMRICPLAPQHLSDSRGLMSSMGSRRGILNGGETLSAAPVLDRKDSIIRVREQPLLHRKISVVSEGVITSAVGHQQKYSPGAFLVRFQRKRTCTVRVPRRPNATLARSASATAWSVRTTKLSGFSGYATHHHCVLQPATELTEQTPASHPETEAGRTLRISLWPTQKRCGIMSTRQYTGGRKLLPICSLATRTVGLSLLSH